METQSIRFVQLRVQNRNRKEKKKSAFKPRNGRGRRSQRRPVKKNERYVAATRHDNPTVLRGGDLPGSHTRKQGRPIRRVDPHTSKVVIFQLLEGEERKEYLNLIKEKAGEHLKRT